MPAGAPVASYDVQVMLVDGKKGVGVELFAVLLGDPAASFLFPLDDAMLGVRSDHAAAYTSGTNSVYADGACGVVARIFATASASNSGDGTMQTDNPRSADRKCALYPRKLTIDYGDGVVQPSTVFVNARDLQNTDPASVIPQGTTVQRRLTLQEGRCGSLRWAPVLADGTVSGADFVNVTRIDASTWLVATQPYPNDKTYCNVDGRLRHIQARFQVVTSRPLPM